jgi:NAD(P)-dependent dehydrogenase (short-subunit alcohol dehydrogenase family)
MAARPGAAPPELEAKVAIVTGGASGIGRATVKRLAQEGARVVIADVAVGPGEELAAALGAVAAFRRTDVADAAQVQALVDFTVEHFGGLHVLFNNAGCGSPLARFLDTDLSDFAHVMNVNLYSAMVASQCAARHMATHGGGSIINNSSIAGIDAGAGVIAYRAAKAAVIHFSRSIAVDLGPYGIRVNCVAPAHIATAINTNYDMDGVIKYTQPLPRHGVPNDVAEAVLYLASDRSAQVTGIVLPIDGGTTAGPPPNQLKVLLNAARGERA